MKRKKARGRWKKERAMEFRWVAIIALWTLLIGPVLGPPTGSPHNSAKTQTTKTISPEMRAPANN
jgi:hypothetical protein